MARMRARVVVTANFAECMPCLSSGVATAALLRALVRGRAERTRQGQLSRPLRRFSLRRAQPGRRILALIPLALAAAARKSPRSFTLRRLPWRLYAVGVALLGLVDDTLGGEPRGWRGHRRAVLGLRFSTGALKAIGSLGLALYATSYVESSTGRWLFGKRRAWCSPRTSSTCSTCDRDGPRRRSCCSAPA